MRGLLARLRAALSPHALLVIVSLLMLFFGARISAGGAARHTELEARMSAVLSQVRGAGRVEVVLCTSREKAAVFSLREGEKQAVSGALVLAQGADDPLVQMELVQAVSALLGVPASAVSVVAGGD